MLDQDTLLSPQEHGNQQGKLINSIIVALQQYSELKLIRLELAGSWPLFQTEAGRLDLTE